MYHELHRPICQLWGLSTFRVNVSHGRGQAHNSLLRLLLWHFQVIKLSYGTFPCSEVPRVDTLQLYDTFRTHDQCTALEETTQQAS